MKNTTWYLATRAQYILVDAATFDEALAIGVPQLSKFVGRQLDAKDVLIRKATDEEIELQRYHAECQAAG